MANIAKSAAKSLVETAAPRRGWLGSAYARLLEGAGIEVNGNRPWDMRVHDPRLWRQLLWRGTLGLGDAYVAGWWDADALDQFFERLLRARIDRRFFNLPKRLRNAVAALGNLQNLTRAREVGSVHYDLDNALYRAMLGERMVYTCGYWRDAATLDAAQAAKLELVCRKLEFAPGMRVLDIGCGWGSFARYAAEHHGVEVTGITIAPEQAALARELTRGLPVEIRVQDYREVRGCYDRIVSLGMFEHVGRKNYALFCAQVQALLAADGLFLLHTIGLDDHGSGIDPWVTRYIFPNSEIPTLARLAQAIQGRFKLEDWHNFGTDYARTLRAWHANFDAAWSHFEPRLGPRFQRLWRYYLLMFAGVFAARGLDLWQLVLGGRGRRAGYRRPLL